MNGVRGLILAAGRGSRLKSITEDRPKGMVALKGRPLIAWQLHALRGAGIDQIALVGGYRMQALAQFHLPVIASPRWSETNMVRSLMCAAEWLDHGATVVSYSDIVYDSATVQRLTDTPSDIALTFDPAWLALWSARFADPLSDAETFAVDPSGMLTDIGRRPERISDVQGQYMGLLKFTGPGWRVISQYLGTLPSDRCDTLDMTSLLRALIDRGVRIQAVPTAGPWAEVDNEDDLLLYERSDRVKLPRPPPDFEGNTP